MRKYFQLIIFMMAVLTVIACGEASVSSPEASSDPSGDHAILASVNEMGRSTQAPVLPDWAVRYGREFWRVSKTSKNSGALTGAIPDASTVISRVQNAFRSERDGQLVSRTETYRAAVGERGFNISSPDERDQTKIEFKTISFTASQELLSKKPSKHVASLGNTVQTLLNGKLSLVEHLMTSPDHLELSWILNKKIETPNGLAITVSVEGLPFSHGDETGLHYAARSGNGKMRIANAIAVDAIGRRWPLELLPSETGFQVNVPSTVLSQAQYPLAIDPAIYPSFDVSVPTTHPATSHQWSPKSASNGLLTNLIVWLDQSTGAARGIWGARVNSSTGEILDPYGILIYASSSGESTQPQVTWRGIGGNGEFYVVFRKYNNVTFHYGIALKRVDDDGSLLDGEAFIIEDPTVDDSYPAIACGPSVCMATWNEGNSSTGNDVVGRIIDPSGNVPVLYGNKITICDASEWQGRPDIAFDGEYFAVVWDDWRSGAMDIYAARVTASGAIPAGDPADGRLIVSAVDNQANPSIVFDGTQYLVVWEDNREGSSISFVDDIYAMFLGTDGVPFGQANGYKIYDSANRAQNPDVAFNGTRFLVVLEDKPGLADDKEIMGVLLNANGTVASTSAISTQDSDQLTPSVSASREGDSDLDFVVSWVDARNSATSGNDIYSKTVSSSGVLNPDSPLLATLVSSAANQNKNPAIASDGVNFLIVWSDDRGGNFDIYGARVSANGEIGDPYGQGLVVGIGDQTNPALAYGSEGYFLVYQDSSSGNSDLYGKNVRADLVASSAFAVSAKTGNQTAPSLSWNGNDAWLVVWEDTIGGVKDIFGGRFSVPENKAIIPEFTSLDGEGFIINNQTGTQATPHVAFNGGRWFVTWRSNHTNGWEAIYGTGVSTSGVVESPTGSEFGIATGFGYRYNPRVAPLGMSDFAVAYTSGTTDVDILTYIVSYSGTSYSLITVADTNGGRYDLDLARISSSTLFVVWKDLRSDAGDIYGARIQPGNAQTVPEINGISINSEAGEQSLPRVAVNNLGDLMVVYNRPVYAMDRATANRVCSDCCQIDGEVVENNSVNPENICQKCNSVSFPFGWSANDGVDCDDDNACTVNDHCSNQICGGQEYSCDDNNVCTDDTCDGEGGCIRENNVIPCDDGIACTLNDVCAGGVCTATPTDSECDDNVSCTQNECEPENLDADSSGCVEVRQDAACNDDALCTVDTCNPDHVEADGLTGCFNQPVDDSCDDSVGCTIDSCAPGSQEADATSGCVHAANSAFCIDAYTCTSNSCNPESVNADPETGCAVTFNNAVCNDSFSCSTDTCNPSAPDANVLTGCAYALDSSGCDDSIPCTLDTCQPGNQGAQVGTGCVFSPDDGFCAIEHECAVSNCEPAHQSSDAMGCLLELNDSLCDDSSICTSDTCELAGCSHGIQNQWSVCDENAICYDAECEASGPGDYCVRPVLNFPLDQEVTYDLSILHQHLPMNWTCKDIYDEASLFVGGDMFFKLQVEAGYVYSVELTPQAEDRLAVFIRDSCEEQLCPEIAALASSEGQPLLLDSLEPEEDGIWLFQIMPLGWNAASGDITVLVSRRLPVDGDLDGDIVDGDLIDGDVVDGDVVDGDVVDGDLIDGDTADGDVADGDPIDGDAADGDVADGDSIDGDAVDGDMVDGDSIDGDMIDGDVPDGDLVDGDATDGDVLDGDETDGDLIDGDQIPDGDLPSDGDTPNDGDITIDGDEPSDGDVVPDGDSSADGDTPVDGDEPAGSGGGGCNQSHSAPPILFLLGLLALATRRRHA
jgi:hypothetical protein